MIGTEFSQKLAGLGLCVSPETMALEWREWRWVARLGTDRICFFAETEAARIRLHREAKLLNSLAGRVACRVPSVIHISEDGGLQVRTVVPGQQVLKRERSVGTSAGMEVIADGYGAAVASLHQAIDPADAELLTEADRKLFLLPADALRTLSQRWINDQGLAKATISILDAYADIKVVASDRVLIHGDLMAGNIAIAEASRQFIGMFDFSDAEIGDRHLDLKYVHSFGRQFAERMMSAYEEHSAINLDRQRPAIYHIAAAISHLGIEGQDGEPAQRQRVEQWVREFFDIAF